MALSCDYFDELFWLLTCLEGTSSFLVSSFYTTFSSHSSSTDDSARHSISTFLFSLFFDLTSGLGSSFYGEHLLISAKVRFFDGVPSLLLETIWDSLPFSFSSCSVTS